MKIESERLKLKEIWWDDLDAIHRLHMLPEVDKFNTLGIPESIEETKLLVAGIIDGQSETPQKKYAWKIVLKTTGEFIGMAGMNLSNDRFRLGELYFKLMPDFWGKGYATEVSKRLIQVGFDNFQLHKMEAGVAVGNINSIKVLEKLGMVREGLRRKILPIRGEWIDNYHYAIVEDDPRNY